MRRIFVLALAALALLGVVTPDAFAQAPTPTFKINGLIDQVTSYNQNLSVYDGNLASKDTGWYGRTRGRLDFIGEVGKAKGVVGIELDLAYGQTGSADNNGTNAAVQVCSGCTGSFDINTDVRTVFELKWLYTEFEVPLIPVPTVARIGAQPFGGASNYKFAVYANGDYAGLNVVSTITPNIKLNFTYAQVEEQLSGCTLPPCTGTSGGIPFAQLRGDDFAIIASPEITPIKGLDLKPMYSYFYASGTTNAGSRTARGGVNTTTAYTAANGDWRPGINENRHTVGMDGRIRMGPFSLDPTIMYQFGNRETIVPGNGVGGCPAGVVATIANCPQLVLASAAGLTPGQVAKADISAWFMDVRGGFQIGPLLLEAMYMFTSGNKGKDTTLNNVHYFQPLDTDTGYLADWGTQISSLGLDYFNGGNAAGGGFPGSFIGWDKYGRQQISGKATYFLTPSLNIMGGAAVHLTHRKIDTDALTGISPGGISGGGLLPAFATGQQSGDTNYLGTELFGEVTWRFAPGLSWGNAAGYMFSGSGLDALTTQGGSRNAKDIFIMSSRVRFTF
jgi:hypothetical protein